MKNNSESTVGQWQPIETAPREAAWSNDGHFYGPKIIAYPVHGVVDTVEWWRSISGATNFIDGGGNAAYPTVWQSLPDPPKEQP